MPPTLSVARTAIAAASLIIFVGESAARAQTKQECSVAYETGQSLRAAGKLIGARTQFVTCMSATCPGAMISSCAQWVAEVETGIPSVVFGAQGPDGKDVVGASLSIDAQPVQALDGTAIPLDPGPHTLRCEASGFAPAEQTFVAHAGERNHLVGIVLQPLAPASPAPIEVERTALPGTTPVNPVVPSDGETPSSPRAGLKATYVLAGVGALAWGATAYFGLQGLHEAHTMQETCKPSCQKSDVDSARAKIVIANLTFGVGVAAFGGAVWTYLASKPRQVDQPKSMSSVGENALGPGAMPGDAPTIVGLDVAPLPGGGTLGVRAVF